jgi:hypothetical protein
MKTGSQRGGLASLASRAILPTITTQGGYEALPRGALVDFWWTTLEYERRAGGGNRTLVCSLEGYRSTIELRPR